MPPGKPTWFGIRIGLNLCPYKAEPETKVSLLTLPWETQPDGNRHEQGGQ